MLKIGPDRLWLPNRDKPRGPFRIDWSDPLTTNLACCFAEELPVVDLVTGTQYPFNSGNTLDDTPYGSGIGCHGASTSNIGIGSGFAPLVTSTGDGTGDFTMLVFANPSATSGGQASIVGQNDGATGDGCFFAINCNATFGASAGGLVSSIYLSGGGNYDNAYYAGGVDGNAHVFAFTRDTAAAVLTLYRDGVSVATKALSTNRNILTGSTPYFYLGGDLTNDSVGMTGTILLTAAWNRALDASEMMLLADNPFAFLMPATNIGNMAIYHAPAAYSMAAASGSYALSGNAAGLQWSKYRLVAESGSYGLTGRAAALRNFRLHAESGSYDLSGKDATLDPTFREYGLGLDTKWRRTRRE